MTTGHVMLDVEGFELTQQEKEILEHPQVGGIILFTRNYESKKQLKYLTRCIHKFSPDCLIAVDQEGGRVQRFKKEFIPLPAFKQYGALYEQNPQEGLKKAQQMAYVMARELLELGIDISFTPVLDMDRGVSQVIADRSFHRKQDIVIHLGRAFIQGMNQAGMPATGKHFPGHGAVADDSHLTLPIDTRQFDEVFEQDIQPFSKLHQELAAIMPAHVLYKSIDSKPPCFSRYWLEDVLRACLKFSGVIFSDDLSMAGAEAMGNHVQRANLALQAGCDMILICNQPEQAVRVLDDIENYKNILSQQRLKEFRTGRRELL
jgi:beta-N-acetylhexosaminidase